MGRRLEMERNSSSLHGVGVADALCELPARIYGSEIQLAISIDCIGLSHLFRWRRYN